MGILSRFEDKMEDGIEGAAGAFGRGGISPVQITKKAERQMRREKMVGAGKQYAPTLYTVLVSPTDDIKLSKYYPTLAGETETYLMARARETGYVMDGHPLVRFLADPDLKKGKFEVVAEVVAANIIQQLRDDEMRRYGLPTRSQSQRRAQGHGVVAGVAGAGVAEANMQPLQNLEGAQGAVDEQRRVEMQLEAQREQARLFAERQVAAQQAADAANGMAGAGYAGGVGAGAAAGAVGVAGGSAGAAAVAAVDMGAASAAAAAAAAPASALAQDTPLFEDNELQVYLYDEARDVAYNLTGAVQTIGRESSNDVVVPDINISRMHAQISRDPDGEWVVADLNSTNGLFVNGRRVQVARLRDADMITLGTSTLEFQLLG